MSVRKELRSKRTGWLLKSLLRHFGCVCGRRPEGNQKLASFFLLFRPHKRLCIHFSLAMLCLDPVDAIKARNCQKGQQDNADYFK